MKTYFGDQDIKDTGIDGDKNTSSTNTDYPEFHSGNTLQYINKDYFYSCMRGDVGHPYTFMSGITNNVLLNTTISNSDAKAGTLNNENSKWFIRQASAALITVCGDIQKLNIALKCIGFSGVAASPLRLYSINQASGANPSWSKTSQSVINTGHSRFGEIGELSRELLGIGGTSDHYGYIYSPNALLPSGATSDDPIIDDSRNTHGSITTLATGNNRLGIPYQIGLLNRAEYTELKVKEILDYLDLASDPDPFQASVQSPDGRSILLYSRSTGASSSIYTTGYIDNTSSSLYPTAILSACTASGRLDTVLLLRREPAAGVNVIVPVDDQGAVNWSTSSMANHPWKISLNGNIIACAGVVQELISNSYIATWKLYIRNVNTSAPSSGQTSRSPVITEEYGQEFYINTTSTGVTEVTFKTSAGKLQNGLPAEFYKKGAVRISTILQAAS